MGIGTSSPRNDTNFKTLQIGDSSTAASQLVLDDNDSNGPWRIISNQSLIINDDTDERMRIASNGEVTIKGSNSSTHPALTLQNTHGAGGSQGSTKLEFSVINSINTDVRSTIISRERTTDSNLSELLFSVSDNSSGNPAIAFTLTGGASAGDATFLLSLIHISEPTRPY